MPSGYFWTEGANTACLGDWNEINKRHSIDVHDCDVTNRWRWASVKEWARVTLKYRQTVAESDTPTLGFVPTYTILALPGPNSTTVLGPGKRACKIASRSLWPGFASANQLSVWNASPQLLIHDHLPFSSSVILKDRVQNSRSWRSQVKSTNQITRNQGYTGHTRRHHNQASRIFNMIGWW